MLRCPLSTRVRSIGRWLRSGERGQAIWWMLLIVPLFAVGAAIVIDSSIWYGHRRAYQNTADAAALAGAQELIDRTDSGSAMSARASAKTDEWRALNEHPPVDFESGFPEVVNDCWGPTSYDGKPDGVKVAVSKDAPLLFMKTVAQGLGIEIGGYAKACVGSLAGISGLRPWALPELGSPCFDNGIPQFGMDCIIRADTTPNTGSIGLGTDVGDECGGGSGSSDYRENIIEGSDAWCDIGDWIDVEPGIAAGPTRQGLGTLLADQGECDWRFGDRDGTDEFGEAFTPADAEPSPDVVYTPNDCVTPRVVDIVIVDSIPQQGRSEPRQIQGFATFFIEQCEGLSSGRIYPDCDMRGGDRSNFQIVGKFMRVFQTRGTGGPLDPFGTRVVSLTE